ncbi:MAG: aldolase/citrate lyase family protein [Chloroflexota bacterium]|nr:aldolase/citrate lyase family protein [Chloroflexota bacterium]
MTAEAAAFRQRVLGGETLFGMFLNLGSPMAAELCGRAGFDWLVLDMEHGALNEAELLASLHAVGSTPATAVVRVEEGTRLRIGRALDFGAPAVMVPRVESAEEAERIVRFVRYPPLGARGVALPTRGARYGEVTHADVASAHNQTSLFIQIESGQSVDEAERIAAVDGVDVLFVGPTDLSHALGVPGDIADARYRDAIRRVGQAAATQGKQAGVLLWTVDDLPAYIDAGFRLIAIGSDGGHVAAGARAAVRALRQAVGG